MAQCLQTVGCNTEIELRDMQQNITRLKRAAEAFQQQGSVSGAHLIIQRLNTLERQVSVSSAGHHLHPVQDQVCTHKQPSIAALQAKVAHRECTVHCATMQDGCKQTSETCKDDGDCLAQAACSCQDSVSQQQEQGIQRASRTRCHAARWCQVQPT